MGSIERYPISLDYQLGADMRGFHTPPGESINNEIDSLSILFVGNKFSFNREVCNESMTTRDLY